MRQRLRIHNRQNLMIQLRANIWFWAIVIGLPTITSLVQQKGGFLLHLYNEVAIKLWEGYVALCVGVLVFGFLALLLMLATGVTSERRNT